VPGRANHLVVRRGFGLGGEGLIANGPPSPAVVRSDDGDRGTMEGGGC